MMRWLVVLLLVTLASLAWTEPDAVDRGLAALGVSRGEFGIDREALLTRYGGPYRLGMFEQWFGDPLRIPFWERHLRDGLLSTKGRVAELFSATSFALGPGTRRDLIPPTAVERYQERAKAADALQQAIRAIDAKAQIPAVTGVPPRVREAAALLLFALADAREWRELALRRVPARDRAWLYAQLISTEDPGLEDAKKFPGNFTDTYRKEELLAALDLFPLLAGADDLSSAFDAACDLLDKEPIAETFAFTCKTKLGEIRLSGGTNDSYAAGTHALLIIDTSGDDRYAAGGATGGADYPAGVLIDVAGNDTYQAEGKAPAFGAGVLGYGLLADLAGNDKYAASAPAEGAGIAGVGCLYDKGGDDAYSGDYGAQGYALFGIGVLSDAAGNDTYDSYTYSQGCGLTMGFGLLCDLAGNDKYTANDTDIKYPSAQTKEHNTSMSQGAGCGERRDYLDGKSYSGGIGMLLDGAGDDSYFGGVFSQAVGYWFGIGILDDRAGNDKYRSVWYGQSATAHFAVSYLVDGGGDDLYTSTNCVNVAAAHDFSVSLFIEEGGNDTYEGAGNLGQGLNCGVALFMDLAGKDTYKGGSFGQSVNFSSTGSRAEIPTYSLFIDAGGGEDSYPGGNYGNGKSWVQEAKEKLPVLRGAGVDF